MKHNENEQKDYFRTTDIVLAAYLKLKNVSMDQIEKQGTKGIFVFEAAPIELLNDFDLGKAVVEPVQFNNTIKQLTTSVRRIL